MVALAPSAEPVQALGGDGELPSWKFTIAVICLGWYIFILLVSTLGYVQLKRHYSSRPPPGISSKLPIQDVPHITILRPVKGLEPHLYECLAACFRQVYPQEKLTIYLCVASRTDPAFPLLQQLVADFPDFDAKVLVEEEDPRLNGSSSSSAGLGPNPKIRNMSRGYREARGDIIWSLDCNVWVGRGVAARMVDKLLGLSRGGGTTRYKFVHHLPLVVDVSKANIREETQGFLGDTDEGEDVASPPSSTGLSPSPSTPQVLQTGGGRLEELFLASSHAKFYTAINTVLIAPCIVGKSNMYRRSHLDALTSTASDARSGRSGIDFFSDNICEDHLIGDLLWKKPLPPSDHHHQQPQGQEKWGKHALLFGDLAIQPMAGMSIHEYIARRVRWLRVRKFTVTLATLVEPGTESLLCSAYGAYAATTLPWFHAALGIPPTWTAFALLWLLSVAGWALVDWTLYLTLHSGASVELDEHTPAFARPVGRVGRRPFREWLGAWVGREALALPIWSWAFWGGTTVVWRGKEFWVGTDMKVHAIETREESGSVDRDVAVGVGKIRAD